MTMTKCCILCGEEYPATREYFSRRSSKSENLENRCKRCKAKIKRKKRQENPEAAREAERQWYASNRESISHRKRRWRQRNPEKTRQMKQNYREGNLEKIRQADRERRQRFMQDPVKHAKIIEYDRRRREADREKDRRHARDYRSRNPEKTKAAHQKWYAKHRAELRVYQQRRAARKRSLPSTLTRAEWNRTVAYWHGFCAYCGKKPDRLTLDHYIPVSHPACPGTVVTNCIPACYSCNCSKNNSDAFYWLTWRFGEEHAHAAHSRILAYFATLE